MKQLKKAISLWMAMLLCFALLPAMGFAEDTTDTVPDTEPIESSETQGEPETLPENGETAVPSDQEQGDVSETPSENVDSKEKQGTETAEPNKQPEAQDETEPAEQPETQDETGPTEQPETQDGTEPTETQNRTEPSEQPEAQEEAEPNELTETQEETESTEPTETQEETEPEGQLTAQAEGTVWIDSESFPDDQFRAWILENFTHSTDDETGKAYFTAEQAANVTRIECENKGVAAVQGIECFPNLSVLSLYGNGLTAIDVSNNTNLIELRVPCNQLTAINVSALTGLVELHLDGNRIGTIDLSNNAALTHLNLKNNQISAIDLSHNAALTYLNLTENPLTVLDLSHNPHITDLQTPQLKTLTMASSKDELLSGAVILNEQEPAIEEDAVYFDLSRLLSDAQLQAAETIDGFDENTTLDRTAGRIVFADENTASGKVMQLKVVSKDENNNDNELWIAILMAGEAQGGDPDNPDEPYEIHSWGVVGGICGTNWDYDFPMTETEEGSGVWVSATLELYAGEEFKVRANGDWVVNYGPLHEAGRDNCWVEEDGVYIVRLDLNAETPVPVAEKQEGVEAEYPHNYGGESWSVAGTICGTNWDVYFPMTETEEGSGVWMTELLTLNAGEELKAFRSENPEESYGMTMRRLMRNGDSLVVPADDEYVVTIQIYEGTITLTNAAGEVVLPVPLEPSDDPDCIDFGGGEFPYFPEEQADEYPDVSGLTDDPDKRVYLNEDNFPDRMFRNWLISGDERPEYTTVTQEDGTVTRYYTDGQAKSVTHLHVEGREIASLAGIAYFPNLTHLYCGQRWDGDFGTVSNYLTELDLSHNTKLACLSLENNLLTVLDVSMLPALKSLACGNNPRLTTLTVGSHAKLHYLSCKNAALTALDVSDCTGLTELDCSFNPLRSLTLTPSLEQLNCSSCSLTELDVSVLPQLTWLDCAQNQLTTLDVSSNAALKTLCVNGNALTEVNLSQNESLAVLNCYGNKIPITGYTLPPHEISGYIEVQGIRAERQSDMDLYTVALDQLAPLLTEADYPHLRLRQTSEAEYDFAAGGSILRLIQLQRGWHWVVDLVVERENGTTFVFGFPPVYENPDILPTESGEVIPIDAEHFPDDAFRAYLLNELTEYYYPADETHATPYFTTESALLVEMINCEGMGVRSLQGIEIFTNITALKCGSSYIEYPDQKTFWGQNELTTLDVSMFPHLQHLSCNGNKLTELDVSHNTELEDLVTFDMKTLTSLDVTRLPKLSFLQCHNSGLTSLDLSNNPNLTYLDCQRNELTSLAVADKPELWHISCELNRLNSLTLRGLPSLTELNCSGNALRIQTLDLSECSALETASVGIAWKEENGNWTSYRNSINVLVLANNANLRRLDCAYCGLADITYDASAAHAAKQSLQSGTVMRLSARRAPEAAKTEAQNAVYMLESLDCSHNNLSSLDMSRLTMLTNLECSGNPNMRSLDLTENTALVAVRLDSEAAANTVFADGAMPYTIHAMVWERNAESGEKELVQKAIAVSTEEDPFWCLQTYDSAVLVDNSGDKKTAVAAYYKITDTIPQNMLPETTQTLFAGWFTDADYAESGRNNDGAYAKFVDANVLRVGVQFRKPSSSGVEGTSDMRLITSLPGKDGEMYGTIAAVGFRLERLNPEDGSAILTVADVAFSEEIYPYVTGNTEDGTKQVTPDAFCADSVKVAALSVRKMPNSFFDEEIPFRVTPYMVLEDGTKVEGRAVQFMTCYDEKGVPAIKPFVPTNQGD